MKKIMFNKTYGLTSAAIDGTKSMTRRGCKGHGNGEQILSADVVSWRFYPDDNLVEFIMTDGSVKVAVPPYKVGEVVEVAQSYKDVLEEMIGFEIRKKLFFESYKNTPGWKNKMFVKADLMPHRIRITDLKVEQLQGITDEDCLKEGVYYDADVDGYKIFNLSLPNKGWGHKFNQTYFKTPREAFSALIDKVSGRGTWERNPWVFVYELEKGGSDD